MTFGGTGIDTSISSGGTEIVSAGGAASDTNVSSGGALIVSSGGVADPTTIFSGGTETVRAGGTDDGARISSGGKLFVQSGGTAIDITIFSGGSAVNSKGGEIDVVAGSATDFGTFVNSGTVNVETARTLTLDAATLNNAGTSTFPGALAATTLLIAHNVTLSGGGTVSMSSFDTVTDNHRGFTLTNVNNKIVGVGGLGEDFTLFLVNEAGGMIDGNGSGIGQLQIVATLTNAGLIEGTTSRGGHRWWWRAPTMNSGTIAALGNNAFAEIFKRHRHELHGQGSDPRVRQRGADLPVDCDDLGRHAEEFGRRTDYGLRWRCTLSGVTIAASSFLVDINDSILTLKGGTIGAGAIIETSGGTAIVSGTVSNGGTLFASAAGDLIEIASGAVVNGGVALIGNGIVEIAGSSGESVKFLSNGSGGLKIADTVGPYQRLQRQGVRIRRFGALEPRRSSSTSCRSPPPAT